MTTMTRREQHGQYARSHGLVSREWQALGTTAHLVVCDPQALAAAHTAVEQVLDAIDSAASRFRPDSELMRLAEADGQWRSVSPTLQQALRVALDAAQWTDGLVDPTVGATLSDLGYDRTFALLPSDAAATLRVRRIAGWQKIDLDEAQNRVRIPAGMIVDLGATAKGLAADLASEAAALAAGCGVLVGLGGDISVAGEPPPAGWPITVTDRTDFDAGVGSEPEQTVTIRSGGLATSSVRARRWRRGGSTFHHIIDPRLGAPSDGAYRTVSVTAATCTLANAASTAAIILGGDAPQWLERQALPARLVTTEGAVHLTAGWPIEGAGA